MESVGRINLDQAHSNQGATSPRVAPVLLRFAMFTLIAVGLITASTACRGTRLTSNANGGLDAVLFPVHLTPSSVPPACNQCICARKWVPAVTKTVCKTVCVKPASVSKHWNPPEYGYRMKLKCVEAAGIKHEVTPAEFKIRRKTVIVRHGSEVVVPVVCDTCNTGTCGDPCGDACGTCGPVEKTCGCWKKEVIPPIFAEKCEKVCIGPSRTKLHYKPAQYREVQERYIVKPATCVEIPVPAQYKTIRRKITIRPGYWKSVRRVLCSECRSAGHTCEPLVATAAEYTPSYMAPPTFTVEPVISPDCSICDTPSELPEPAPIIEQEPAVVAEMPAPAPVEAPAPLPAPFPDAPVAKAKVGKGLPSLQVELVDMNPSGSDAGVFSVGDSVRYRLIVSHDGGTEGMTAMRVQFRLPPSLSFVSGSGEGIVSITGAGQSATSSDFTLPVGESRTLNVLARVDAAPPGRMVKVTADVNTVDGTMLATETESTTLVGSSSSGAEYSER